VRPDLNIYFLLPDIVPADMRPPTPGRPTLHSTHGNFFRSTLPGYQCFGFDTWLFGWPGINSRGQEVEYGTKFVAQCDRYLAVGLCLSILFVMDWAASAI
jgi:hypothetical protein